MTQAAQPQVELATTLAYAQGGYSVELRLGSEARSANVLLDTGSSSLAVLPRCYAPERDRALAPTALAQEISYGGGAWAGPVLRSWLGFGSGRHARTIDDAAFALVESADPPFRHADGILGLAYRDLDPAYDMTTLLQAHGVDPPLTWPWPFDSGHALDLANFRDFLHRQPRTSLVPALSALEEHDVVRDRFGFLAGRAVVHVAGDGVSLHAQAADPLNRGALVAGGGAEQQHLYRGGFADVRILHDLYYNANLRAVQVGSEAPIPVPPLDPADLASRYSNALLDTGSSFLVLEASVYDAVLAALGRHDPRFPSLVAEAQQALAHDGGVANERIDPHAWPDLRLRLEAPGGGDTVLRVHGAAYWPRNALAHGQSMCLLMRQLAHFPKQSILGLPLFAGRYAVFDRRAADGLGVVRFAAARAD
ncbi:pepsin-like aspartic protease [Arenimonas composti]|uniref:Peptidase A1 domain-containing protein n=1 Tax=Arenimonas composti TR7-09 = DSM 18010 TaxID=1121013 RepID=A0A091BD66_9GAMM|nr:pepsin-like aspartic protease [Arenimonas composti]KFN49427.1 hypothetical protein P873_10665 [Arenimonas composti TR7-09 = DSM 18010]